MKYYTNNVKSFQLKRLQLAEDIHSNPGPSTAGNVNVKCQVCCNTLARTHTRPWAVGQNYFVSWHPSGKHLVYGLFERYIGILLPKKFPSKNLPDTEKTGDL